MRPFDPYPSPRPSHDFNELLEQQRAIDRARSRPFADLDLQTQCACERAARQHNKRAGERMAEAFRALPEEERRHTTPAEALRLAEQREQAELDDFLHWQMINNDAIGDPFDQF